MHQVPLTSVCILFHGSGGKVVSARFGEALHNSSMHHNEHRHLSISIRPVRRHEGDSFARQVAYIGRTTQRDTRTGDLHDFSGSDAVEAKGIVGWEGDIDGLVKSAAFAEPRRSKVVEGRIAILALPAEFTAAERHKAVRDCARYLVTAFRVAVAVAIHRPPKDGDERNWHAHLLFTSRVVEAGTALGAKTRALDTLKTGPHLIEAFRVWWCAELNSMLHDAGHAVTIEHKSFARLGIQNEPSCHEGEKRTAICRRRELKERRTSRPLAEPTIGSSYGHGDSPALGFSEIGSSAEGVGSPCGPLPASPPRVRRPLMTPTVNPPSLEPGG